MQRQTHTTEPPRFYISTRGVLMDRQGTGTARRTGYSIEANRATRSEMQILANLLNLPQQMADYDAGGRPDAAWALRIEQERSGARRAA